jgi:hypothetical protein
VVEQDELGKMTVSYKSTGPDDYALAEGYDVVATELFWLRQQLDSARELDTPLENLYEFERSSITDPESTDYSGGFDEPREWSWGDDEREEWDEPQG